MNKICLRCLLEGQTINKAKGPDWHSSFKFAYSLPDFVKQEIPEDFPGILPDSLTNGGEVQQFNNSYQSHGLQHQHNQQSSSSYSPFGSNDSHSSSDSMPNHNHTHPSNSLQGAQASQSNTQAQSQEKQSQSQHRKHSQANQEPGMPDSGNNSHFGDISYAGRAIPRNFNPKDVSFSDDELRPKPIARKRRKASKFLINQSTNGIMEYSLDICWIGHYELLSTPSVIDWFHL